jgi:hypothetical protein
MSIEADFKNDMTTIEERIRQAKVLVKEAAVLADKHGSTLFDLYYDDDMAENLSTIVDIGGWSSSSLGC